MKEQISKFLIGGTGLTGTVVTEQIANINPSQIAEIGGLIVQILIAIATVFSMFKKKK